MNGPPNWLLRADVLEFYCRSCIESMWSWCIIVKSFLGCRAVEWFLAQEQKNREIKQMLLCQWGWAEAVASQSVRWVDQTKMQPGWALWSWRQQRNSSVSVSSHHKVIPTRCCSARFGLGRRTGTATTCLPSWRKSALQEALMPSSHRTLN